MESDNAAIPPKPPNKTPMDRHRERQASDPEYRAMRVAKAKAWIQANYARHLANVRAYDRRTRVLKPAEFSQQTISTK